MVYVDGKKVAAIPMTTAMTVIQRVVRRALPCSSGSLVGGCQSMLFITGEDVLTLE